MNKELLDQFEREVVNFQSALDQRDHEKCFYYLGRAHVLSQKSVRQHLKVHWMMFKYSVNRKDFNEVGGQVLRLLVTIPGHLFGKVPVGNIGWATVRLTETMPVPEDLKHIYFKN